MRLPAPVLTWLTVIILLLLAIGVVTAAESETEFTTKITAELRSRNPADE